MSSVASREGGLQRPAWLQNRAGLLRAGMEGSVAGVLGGHRIHPNWVTAMTVL